MTKRPPVFIIEEMDISFGISVSPGIGSGSAFVIPEPVQRIVSQSSIKAEEFESEWLRYIKARDTVASQIKAQLEQIKSSKNPDKVQQEIFETYSLMLTDPVFNKELSDSLKDSLFNVESVLNAKTKEYADRLRESGNDYLAERGQDITDIFGRVLNELLDIHPFDMECIPDGAVLVAQALDAGDVMVLSKKHITALALVEGGVSSHVAILARNYAIPAVFAVPKITVKIKTGDAVIVDAKKAEVIVCPDEATVRDYKNKIRQEDDHRRSLLLFRTKSARTKDGTRFHLFANIGTVEEAKLALEEGAEGIGLFRTEFLFMNEASENYARTVTEETQFEAYKSVLELMGDRPVTIRTLDAGGDKLLRMVDAPSEIEKNPLMGMRAIRMSLHYPQVFRTQLRALYRAGVYGNLRIMLPLITSLEQVEAARVIADEVCGELEAEGIPFRRDIPVGIMVETAAAALIADCLAKVSDFFSIGTNDLTQYTLGVDRENTNVADLYDEFHLAVLRLIKNTLNEARRHNIPVAVCGEMASRLDRAMVLAGMGFRNLSMSPSQISSVKEKLSTITIKELEAVADGKQRI